MPVQLTPGNVTIADLYREMVGMRADVVRALTRIEVIDARDTSTGLDLADHEGRLRQLERFRYTLGGLALVGGAVAGYVGYILGHFIH